MGRGSVQYIEEPQIFPSESLEEWEECGLEDIQYTGTSILSDADSMEHEQIAEMAAQHIAEPCEAMDPFPQLNIQSPEAEFPDARELDRRLGDESMKCQRCGQSCSFDNLSYVHGQNNLCSPGQLCDGCCGPHESTELQIILALGRGQTSAADILPVAIPAGGEDFLQEVDVNFGKLAIDDAVLSSSPPLHQDVPEEDHIFKLSPSNRSKTFPLEKKSKIKPFSRRMSTTSQRSGLGKALNKHLLRKFRAVLKSACRVLHIYGAPGSGKTEYVNGFISQERLDGGDIGTSTPQITASVSLKESEKKTARVDLLFEVTRQIRRQFEPPILKSTEQNLARIQKAEVFSNVRDFCKQTILQADAVVKILVVIDGITPSAARQHEPALMEIMQLCVQSTRMKCIISSQERLDICTGANIPSGLVSTIDLNGDEEIRNIMEKSLNDELVKKCGQHVITPSPAEIEQYSRIIVQNTNCTFIFAELILRHIFRKIASATVIDTNAFPSGGPDEFYTFALDQVPQHSLSLTKEMCSWAMCAGKKFTPAEIADILILKDNPIAEPIKGSEADIIKYCENKLEWVSADLINIERDVPSSFIHESAPYYLLNGDSRFSIPGPDAHETVALTQINYLANADLEKDLSSDCEQRKAVSEYIVTSLPEHCQLAEGKATCLPAMLLHFMENKFQAFKKWAEAYDKLQPQSIHQKFIPNFVDGESVLMCATFGFATLTNLLLERGRDPNGMRYDPMPCDVAMNNGFPRIASMLLQYGANQSHLQNIQW